MNDLPGKETVMKKFGRITIGLCVVLIMVLISPMFTSTVQAKDLDYIHEYTITADVQEDGKVKMKYHIEWEVLDSKSEGPLEWVKIGIANKQVTEIRGLTNNIRKIKYYSDGGSYIRIDFDRKYIAGEIVTFEFEILQDYIYQMNMYKEGETVYEFTPGWFDDINVKKLTLKWNNEKIESYSPAGLVGSDGYVTWEKKLNKGNKFNVQITYLNSAFDFDIGKSLEEFSESSDTFIAVIIYALILGISILFTVFGSFINRYSSTANMSGTTKRKVKRTKVTYYAQCPSCSAPRVEGKENCEYCGRSMIQSEEILEDSELKTLDPDIKSNKNNEGLYRFGSSNTYMRVHVSHIFVPTPVRSNGGYRGGHGCACACACACAGGGRAGCSTKDFYNTGLKLRQLKLKKNKKV